MADQKVTKMVLKVDLQCCRCYKKNKKVLCKFLQIQDQVYDEKTNTIVITVVHCNPEKIKQKIICKAGDTLQCIEIKEPEKPKPPKTEPTTKPPSTPKTEQQLVPVCNYPPQPFSTCCIDCYQGRRGGPCYRGCSCPLPAFGTCCSYCYQGNPNGPCYRGYDRLPPQCYQYDGYGGGRTYCTNENSGTCSLM